jgi:hypothetical protein
MPIFDAKFRTVEGYLAGIGASSALLAGALLAFVILVGVTTFESWPRPESLFPGSGDNVTLDATTAGIRQPPAESSPPDLSPVRVQPPAIPSPGGSELGGGGGGAPGGGTAPGGTAPQGSPSEPAQAPPGAPTPGPNVVQQTVSGVGNTVEGTTTVLGDTLGGSSSPGLGGLVGGLGQTVNSTLQSLAGTQ